MFNYQPLVSKLHSTLILKKKKKKSKVEATFWSNSGQIIVVLFDGVEILAPLGPIKTYWAAKCRADFLSLDLHARPTCPERPSMFFTESWIPSLQA